MAATPGWIAIVAGFAFAGYGLSRDLGGFTFAAATMRGSAQPDDYLRRLTQLIVFVGFPVWVRSFADCGCVYKFLGSVVMVLTGWGSRSGPAVRAESPASACGGAGRTGPPSGGPARLHHNLVQRILDDALAPPPP